MRGLKALPLLAGLVMGVCGVAHAENQAVIRLPRAPGWLMETPAGLTKAPPADIKAELAEVKKMVAGRSAAEVMRARWWDTGGPAYRWNELAIEIMLEDFVTLPLAARHLALLQAAIDDAVAAAWADKRKYRTPRPRELDASLVAVLPTPKSSGYPSDYAAAAAAAAEILGHLFPARAEALAARAEEAMKSRILAGVAFPSDIAAGREIGRKIADLAIARAKGDGWDAKWTGSVPQGPGYWLGENPIAPMAGTWRTWVLSRPDEFRPAAPPAFDSDSTKADLAELKSFKRTPKSNHRAVYWEVFGGARAYALWNQIARMKLLEYGAQFDPPTSARALAALNIAFHDSTVACWDAKYAYWRIRPSQLAPELKTVFPPPGHPSYPAAHGCLSTAAATFLAEMFRADREWLLAQGREAAEARVWAGIHYRSDIDAGEALGRKVAEKVLLRAFTPAKP